MWLEALECSQTVGCSGGNIDEFRRATGGKQEACLKRYYRFCSQKVVLRLSPFDKTVHLVTSKV